MDVPLYHNRPSLTISVFGFLFSIPIFPYSRKRSDHQNVWTGKPVAAGFSLRLHRLESLCHQSFTFGPLV
jgi:hypothetical protein